MKLKDSIIITSVDDYYVLVDTSLSNDRFNGVVKLNETGKVMCNFLKEDINFNELMKRMNDVYNGDYKEIENDVRNTLNKLKDIDLIID